MHTNQLRRGLAAAAVGALATSGLAAVAAPASAADGDGVILISQASGKASVRVDGGSFGSYEAVDLVAQRVDPNMQVTFQVNPDPAAADDAPGWVDIDTSPDSEGSLYHARWNGMAGAQSTVGTSVALRVVGVDGDETDYSTMRGVAVTGGGSSPVHSVSVDHDGGYFVQPYDDSARTGTMVGVRGTTSATSGTVQLDWWDAADHAFAGQVDAAVSPTDLKVLGDDGPTEIPGGAFDAVLDIAGYDATAGSDALAVRAQRDTDEVTVAPSYEQTVTAVTAMVATVRSSGVDDLDVVVSDQEGATVAGAEVRRSSDGSLVGYTDGRGIATASQAAGSTESFYVNTTDEDGFEAGTDPVSAPVEAPAYTPVASGTRALLADGPVFDDDEYAAGDLALQVVDQEGTPMAVPGVQLSYALAPSGQQDPQYATATSDDRGRAVVPFVASGPDGAYTLAHGLAAGDEQETEFVAGDATLTLAPGAGTAASGGEIAYAGRLSVGSAPLAGRTLDVTFGRGTELVPGTAADAGLGTARALAASVTTGPDGAFSVLVDDPSEAGAPAETGGRLTATAGAAKETVSAAATFGSGPGTVRLKLAGSSKGGAADRLVVTGTRAVAGERVKVFAKVGARWRSVKSAVLDRTGKLRLRVKDRNGTARTSYYVRLLASARTTTSKSNTTKLS